MRRVFAHMHMVLVACHNGAKRLDESVLTAYARACGHRDEAELLCIALNDRAEFVRRYAAVSPPCYSAHQAHPSRVQAMREAIDEAKAKEAGHVCDAVVGQFLWEEIVHQVLDVMFPWWDSRPRLSSMRPCRPPNAGPVEVDDEVLSSIGRDLLTLAGRQLKRARKAA
jgi:hypothetical protein